MSVTYPLNENETAPVGKLTYEQALAELESIVTALESNQHTLEETLALFERGQNTGSLLCRNYWDQAELKVQQLSGNTLTDFTPPA